MYNDRKMIYPASFPIGKPWVEGFNHATSKPPLNDHVQKAPLEITFFRVNSKDLLFQNTTSRRPGHFEIVWIIEGSGQVLIDTGVYEICENLIYRINPGNVHYFKEAYNLKGYTISFHKEFLLSDGDILNEKHFNDTVAQIDANIKIEMIQLLTSMENELKNSRWLQTDVLRGFLKIFLIYLARHRVVSSTTETGSFNSGLTKRFFDIVEIGFTKNRKVSYYADALSVTAGYLNERIKKDSGFSASCNIQKRIVLEAKRMAITTDSNLKQIAYDLGFDDSAHFSKFFKNVCGLNFTEYKQTIKLKSIL
jgi:AraC family transcriptional activator of pobA